MNKKQFLESAEKRIQKFESWFISQGAEPLAHFEKAIIKTFLLAEESEQFKEFFLREDSIDEETV